MIISATDIIVKAFQNLLNNIKAVDTTLAVILKKLSQYSRDNPCGCPKNLKTKKSPAKTAGE